MRGGSVEEGEGWKMAERGCGREGSIFDIVEGVCKGSFG